MADRLEELKKAADAAARYYDLTLKEQDKLNAAIEKGAVKSMDKLADQVATLAKVSIPDVVTMIEEFNEGFVKSVKNTKSLSDNILSSKSKLHKLLQSTQDIVELNHEAYSLQRKSLQTKALSLTQMKNALAITAKELNLRNRVVNASAQDLTNKELLLQVLKNAGDISPRGFQFIEETVFGRMKKAQNMMRSIKGEIAGNNDELAYFNSRLPQMESALKSYVSKLGYRGKLLNQRSAVRGRTDLDASTKGSMQNDITAKLKAVESQLASSGYSSYADFKKAIDDVKDKIDTLVERQGTLNSRLNIAKKAYEDERTSLDSTDKAIKGILDTRLKLESTSTSINDKSKILLGLMQQASEVNADQVAMYSQYLKLLNAQQQVTGEVVGEEYRMYSRRAKILEKAYIIHEDIQRQIKDQFDMLSEISSFVPYIGLKLAKGFDKAEEKISTLARDMYQEFALTLSNTGNGSKAVANAMSVAFKRPGVALALGFAAAAIAAKVLFNAAHNLSKTMEQVSQATGLTADQALVLERAGIRTQIRYDNVLSSMKDIRDAQAGIISEAGFFLQVSNDVLNTVSNTGRAYGYGSKMAGQLHTELMQISGGSETLAANTQVALAAVAEAEGLAPGLLPKDIVQNSETVAKYFTGYPKDLAKTVIQIHKMGLGLGQLDKMMSHLLDYEKSITAEFEASVALNRHVNVGKARDLLLQEDILGAMQQMRKEAGSLAEFEDMGFARRKLMANAMGLSVKETRKMLFVSEQLSGESKELQESTLENYDLIQKLTGGNQSLFKVQAKNVQATQKFNTAVQKIGMAFKTALLPLLEAMMPLISGMASMVSLIAKGIQGLLAPLTIVSSLLGDLTNWDGGMTRTKNSLGSLAPTREEDGSIGGSVAKVVGMLGAGALGIKGIQRLRGKGGKSRGLMSKIPGIGGLGRGNTPTKPLFVSMVGGFGGLGGGLGGGLRRGGKGAKAGRFLNKATAARYASRFGKGAALRRFGGAAMGFGGMSMGGKLLSKVGGKGLGKMGGGLLSKVGGKGLGKMGGKALLGTIGKKIPLLSVLIGAGMGISRLAKGDMSGAGLELLSGIAGTFPGLGTAASLGIDGALLARDAGMIKGKEKDGRSISKVKEAQLQHSTEITSQPISREELMNQNKQLVNALDNVRTEISMMRQIPSIAVIEDGTAKDLNRKLKSYNGS